MTAKEFFKRYSFFPPLLVLATNLTVSFVTRPFINYDRTVNIVTSADKAIPFVPEFIYVYFLAFVQWAICLIAVMILDKRNNWRFCLGISVGNILSGIVFIVLPTVMSIRPEFSGGGALTELLGRFLFTADTPPKNILPSLHCLHSWGCMRMIFAVKRIPARFKAANAVFTFLVFASVLFVKQHLIIDIPTGILAFELGFIITSIAGRFKNKLKG